MVGFHIALFLVIFLFSAGVSRYRPRMIFLTAVFGTLTVHYWVMFEFAGMQFTFIDAVFAGFVLAELPRLLNKRALKFPALPSFLIVTVAITLFLALYLALPTAAVLFSGWGPSVLTPGLRMAQWMSYGLFAGILHHRCQLREIDLLKLAYTVILVQTAYAGLQQLEFAGFLTLPHHSYFAGRPTWFIGGRSTGLFVNPNRYGILMAVLAPFAIITGLQNQNQVRWVPISIAGVSVIGILMSGSRTGMLMFIAALGLYGVKIAQTHPAALTGVLLTITPFASIINSLTGGKITGRFGQIISVLTGDFESAGNLIARFKYWKDAIDYVTVHGPSFVHRAYVPEINHAIDNVFVTLYVQAGIIGPIIYGFLLAGIAVFAHRTALATDSVIPRAASLLAVMIAVGSNLIEVIAASQISMVFWVVTGITLSKFVLWSTSIPHERDRVESRAPENAMG